MISRSFPMLLLVASLSASSVLAQRQVKVVTPRRDEIVRKSPYPGSIRAAMLVALSDNFLKPILMGRGVDAPMLVIFLGAIGGFITSGFIGLFIGAVITVLAYQLFMAWLAQTSDSASEAEEVAGP